MNDHNDGKWHGWNGGGTHKYAAYLFAGMKLDEAME